MAIKKFKICPACGEQNPPTRFECNSCETDLTSVKVVDDSALISDTATTEGNNTSRALVRLCDCGASNPPQARKCASCGEDISDLRPTEDCASSTSGFSLSAVEDGFSFALDKPVITVGRDADMKDYLADKAYVSRRHAKLTITEAGVYLENISSTNRTFVNDILVSNDAPVLLKNGNEIGLGGKKVNGSRQKDAAYFIFEARP